MIDERDYQERQQWCRICAAVRWHYRYVHGTIGRWCCSWCGWY